MSEELAYAILAVLGVGLLVEFFCALYLFKLNKRANAANERTIALAATTHSLMKEHTAELQRARLRVR